jgi:hypothetical protein
MDKSKGVAFVARDLENAETVRVHDHFFAP